MTEFSQNLQSLGFKHYHPLHLDQIYKIAIAQCSPHLQCPKLHMCTEVHIPAL